MKLEEAKAVMSHKNLVLGILGSLRLMKKTVSHLLVLLLLFGPLLLWAKSQKEYLRVNNPKVKTYNFDIGNITIGNPKVVDFKADREKNRLTLFPKNPGTTLLMVYDQKDNQREVLELTVYSRDPNRLLDQIRQLLVDVEGISIKKLNNKIIIDGEVFLPSDKERIEKIKSNMANIVDLTRMSPNSDQVIAKKIQEEIGLDEVQVRSIRGKIVLEGEVYSPQASIKAEKIAMLYSTNVINVLDLREVPRPPSMQPTIQINAHFVEVSKNFSKNFNFTWNPVPNIGTNLSYTLNPVSGSTNFNGSVTGSANNLLPKLNYFKSLGLARILENPSVSVKSGEVATIESGTRLGFPVAQGNGTVSLEFQNVGAKLKIRPYARGTDVDMSVEVKISSLGAPSVNGNVSIVQNSVNTTQIVQSGESVVIGGLIRHSYRQFFDRPPTGNASAANGGTELVDPFPLGSLFTLFKSNDLSKQRSQFLVFITPKILKYSKDSNQELKDQFNLYEVYPDANDSVDEIKNEVE